MTTARMIEAIKKRFGESQFTDAQDRELEELGSERQWCKSKEERATLEARHVSWSTKTVGELLAEYEGEVDRLWQARADEVLARRAKARASFTPKVKARLTAARVKDASVVACDDDLLDRLMECGQWDLRSGVIVQDALIVAQHNSRYAVFDRDENGKWDGAGLVLQDHIYPMTALTLSTLDDTINFVARLLVRRKLASRSRS